MVDELFIKRRSYRKYLPKEVEEDKLNDILESGMLAPIASGKYFNVVLKVFRGEELKTLQETLVKETGNDNTYKAPLVIGVYHKGENVELANLDAGAIIENMLLEARELGLYMQKYCGCIFSEEDRYKKKIEKDKENLNMKVII